MSTDHKSDQKEKVGVPENSKSLLKKRLIWQHLAQKKIRKAIREKLKVGSIDD